MFKNSAGNVAVLSRIIEFDIKFGKKNTINDKDDKGNTPLISGRIWIINNMESQVHNGNWFVTGRKYMEAQDQRIMSPRNLSKI